MTLIDVYLEMPGMVAFYENSFMEIGIFTKIECMKVMIDFRKAIRRSLARQKGPVSLANRYLNSLIALGMLLSYSAFLSAQEEKPVLKLGRHSAPVNAVAWNPDGKILATGSDDKSIILWNAETGEMINTLNGHLRGVTCLVWTSDGKTLISGGDRNIQLWGIDGIKSKTLTGLTTDPHSLAVSPDGRLLVAGTYDKRIPVWDIASGKIIKVLEGHQASVLAVSISPDGKYLASGSLDQTVRLWDLSTFQCVKIWRGHGGNIFTVAFSPDSKMVVSGSKDNTLRLWDVNQDKSIRTFTGHDMAVLSARFTPNGKWLLSASYDKTVILWEVPTGKKIFQFIGFDGPVNQVAVSPDGSGFATASSDNKTLIWRLNPDLFVDAYYEKEITGTMDTMAVFKPRNKGESREDFEKRQEEGRKARKDLYEKYFQLYLKKLAGQKIE